MFSPFRVIFIFLLLAIAGIFLIPQLSVDLMPARYEPILTVSFQVSQTDPENVEQQVTSLLENSLSQIPNLKKITSVSRYDYGSVSLYFDKIEDLDFARFEVANLIRQLYPKLPKNCSYPSIEQSRPDEESKKPLLVYSVNANLSTFYIKKIAEDVFRNTLSSNINVEKIEILGSENQQITISYNLEKMRKYEIQISDIIKSMQENTQFFYIGIFKENQQQFSVRLSPSQVYTSVEKLENIVIKYIHNADNSISQQVIRLGDVATVYLQEQEAQYFYRINGLNSVRLLIYTRSKVNQLVAAEQLQKQIAEKAAFLPKGFKLILESNQVEVLSEEINKNYQRALLSLSILLIFTLLWYRNWRNLLIILSSLCINLALLALFLYFTHITVHLYTLAGITVSMGLIIDNAIMVVEYLKRKKYHHEENWNSLLRALLGLSMCIVAALLLIFFLPEKERMDLTDFVLVVSANMFISVFVAAGFTKSMGKFLYKNNIYLNKRSFTHLRKQYILFSVYENFIFFLQKHSKIFTISIVLSFGLPVFLLPTQIAGWEWYNKTLGNEWYLEHIRPKIDIFLGGSLRLFTYNIYENSGYRKPDETILYVNAEMPMGVTLSEMNKVIEKMELYLQDCKGVKKFVSSIYSGQYANILIYFTSESERSGYPFILKNQIIKQSLDLGGVSWNIYGVGEGFSNKISEQMGSFRVEMRGYNYKELDKQARILAQKLLKHKRIQTVNTNEKMNYFEKSSTELYLMLDSYKVQANQISTQKIMQIIQFWAKPTTWQASLPIASQYIPIQVRNNNAEDFNYGMLRYGTLYDADNKIIKIENIGDLKSYTTSNAIYKENREYLRLISFEYMGSQKFGNKFLEEKLEEMRKEMPSGYKASQQEFSFFMKEQKKRQYELLGIVFIGIFVVCSITFESIKKAIYTILIIPICFIGLFMIFYWGNFYFDQGGYAAFVMLSGTAISSAIFILIDWNKNGDNHRKMHKLLKISFQKFMPMFITILTSILGFLPFISEGDKEIFWFSLAIGNIGGLIASLWAVWVCLPVWLKKY
ncbi:MAG: efflux RND transporter permease subunit [Thermonemataceae bacterium]|nr:efflux RND transporter permease subunit [Thermonemataceae bacterium]